MKARKQVVIFSVLFLLLVLPPMVYYYVTRAFNTIINSGGVDAVKIAVAGLRAEYETSEGYEGRMLTGKAPKTSDVYRSQAEVVQALSDPRYDRDPAYRQDLYDKLERSNVKF